MPKTPKKSQPRVSIPVGSLASRTPGRPAYQYRPHTATVDPAIFRASSYAPASTSHVTPQSHLAQGVYKSATATASAGSSPPTVDNYPFNAPHSLSQGSNIFSDDCASHFTTPSISRSSLTIPERSHTHEAEVPRLRSGLPTPFSPILDDSLPAREDFWSRRALEAWEDDVPSVDEGYVKAAEAEQAVPGANLHFAANYRLVERFLTGSGPPLNDQSVYEKKHVRLDQLPIVFDSLNNDYNLQYQTVSKLVTVRFLGPPGLKPYDVRGRFAKFSIDPSGIEDGPDRCVWRSVYTCSGSCERVDPVYHLHINTSETDDFLRLRDHPQEHDQASGALTATTKHSPCPFYLFLEMTPASIEKGVALLIIGMPEFHAEPQNKNLLRISLAARNFLHTSATSLGTSMSKIKKLWNISERDGSIHRRMLARNGPLAHRAPAGRDFETALDTAMRRERLDEMPLAAIEILHTRHPASFLLCQYPPLLHNMRSLRFDKDSRFICIIAPPHGLHNALRFAAENGFNVDSSWRNKNANRSPVTVASTSNEYGHLVPVAVMVSSHADAKTYATFLRTVKEAIENEAKLLLDDPSRSTLPAKHTTDLLSYAEDVVVAEEFCPAFVTIDCDDAERNAIREVWGNVTIILCQFHFMQAARLKGGLIFGRNDQGRVQTVSFLRALRKCQRCAEEHQWAETYNDFRLAIRAVVRPEQSVEEIWSKIDSWLTKWWFSDRWRECLVDYGLPALTTRGGPLSTNNLVEGVFRVFDRVYLDGQVNKRIDRLIAIIVVDFFPSFELSPPEKQRSDPQARKASRNGLRIWSTDALRLCTSGDIPPSVPPLAETYMIQDPDDPYIAHYCGIRLGGRRQFCSCPYFQQTGKQCCGLYAWAYLQHCGHVHEYEAQSTAIHYAIEKSATSEWRRACGTASSRTTGSSPINSEEDAWDLRQWYGGSYDPQATPAEPAEAPFRPKTSAIISIDSSDLDAEDRPSEAVNRRAARARKRAVTPSDLPVQTTGTSPRNQAEIQLSGRPAHLRPLHPSRTPLSKNRAQKSSLAIPLPPVTRPSGGKNNGGNQCFALSLLHIILRQDAFVEVFERNTESLRLSCPNAVTLIEEFLHAVRTVTVVDIKDMNDRLRNDNIIDTPATVGQPDHHDPSETLNRLVSRFDNCLGTTTFGAIMGMTVQWTFPGPCEHRAIVDTPVSRDHKFLPGVIVKPGHHAFLHGRPPSLEAMIRHSLHVQDNNVRCPSCGIPTRQALVGQLVRPADAAPPSMLSVEIAWSTNQEGRTQMNGTFHIPPSLSLDVLSGDRRGMVEYAGQEYQLCGIICYKNVAHYVCVVLSGGVWWEIDDGKVTRFLLMSDVFTETRLPKHLFYARPAASAPALRTPAKDHPVIDEWGSRQMLKDIPTAGSDALFTEVQRRMAKISWRVPTSKSRSVMNCHGADRSSTDGPVHATPCLSLARSYVL